MINKEQDSAVLFIIFNRPDTTFQVFERIRQARPSKLFIAADGPRIDRVGEAELCAQARSVVDLVDWDCDVHTLLRDENLGCKWGPASAIDWFFQHVQEGIILEDDCVPDISFFPYCQELLEKYRDNPKILSISGFNFGYSPNNAIASYSFSRYMNMWGWATWRRSAKLIDYKLDEWKDIDQINFLNRNTRRSLFDFDWKWIKDWRKTYTELISKKVDAWDYFWIYAGMKFRTLSIFPHVNLIHNQGFNSNATHTHDNQSIMGKIHASSIRFPLSHPKQIKRNYDFEENYIKKIWQSYFRKGLSYQLKSFLREEVLPNLGKH